jgi:hypothetical protein
MNKINKLFCVIVITAGVNLPSSSFAQEMTFDVGEMAPAAQGDENHTDSLLTQQQGINGGVVGGRSMALAPTYNNAAALKSVNMSPFPSGSFSYGFPAARSAPFTGVSQKAGFGGMLPAASTSSSDINTCDLPFLRSSMGISLSIDIGFGSAGTGTGSDTGSNSGNGSGNATVAAPSTGD